MFSNSTSDFISVLDNIPILDIMSNKRERTPPLNKDIFLNSIYQWKYVKGRSITQYQQGGPLFQIQVQYQKPRKKEIHWATAKVKGQRQALYERGKLKEGMKGPQSEDARRKLLEEGKPTQDLNMCTTYVLSQEPDFKNEECALEKVLKEYGYSMSRSPKCHPELAGNGIEFDWGCGKLQFRNNFNDEVPGNLSKNIFKSLSVTNPKCLTIDKTRKFARRARDYMFAYKQMRDNKELTGIINKKVIDNMTKKRKAHRNIVDSHSGFIGEE